MVRPLLILVRGRLLQLFFEISCRENKTATEERGDRGGRKSVTSAVGRVGGWQRAARQGNVW